MGLLEALKQYASDAVGGSLNPEVGNTLSGLLNYGKDRAKYIGGLLDDSSPINKDFKNWHDRTQLGLADLIAGKEGPQADYGYSQIMNMAGNVPMGITKVVGPRHEAMETARKNAVKMLGLPENNTAMDRAKVLGFDVDGFHGMPTPLRGTSFDPSMTAKNDYGAIGQGVYIDPSKDASYANAITDLLGNLPGSNVIPVKVRSGSMMDASELPAIYSAERSKAVTEGLRQRGVDSVMSFVNGNPNEMMVIDPSNIRSRFAAFDPARRHEADLLGRATPEMLGLTTLGSLLGLEAMRRNQE